MGRLNRFIQRPLADVLPSLLSFHSKSGQFYLNLTCFFVHKDTHCYCGPLRPIKLHLPKDDLNLNMTLI